jgi:hypothetical protein
MRQVRRFLLAPLAGLALLAAGCGDKMDVRTQGDTEGVYIDVGPLLYQVQISRYLNPADREDSAYLAGLPEGMSTQPGRGRTWFGVFMRVQNVTGEPLMAADTYEIHDTQENVYEPVELDRDLNPFAYVAGEVPPHGVVPEPDSAAGQGFIKGSLLLFKVKVDSLQNRPLELRISGGGGDAEGVVDLDV